MKIRAAVASLLLGALATLAQAAPQQATPAQAAPQQKVDPAKEADIRRLFEVMGAKKLAEQAVALMMEQINPSLQRALPQNERGQKFMETFLQKFQMKFNVNRLMEQVIPIYDKYLSAEDIKGLIQFYESPLGQRMVKVLPQITRESQLAGAQLGQRIAREVFQELQEQYPELKQEQKPGPGNP